MSRFWNVANTVLVVACIVVACVASHLGRWDMAATLWAVAIFVYIGDRSRRIEELVVKLGDIVLLDAEMEDAADLEMAHERMKEPGIPWKDVKRDLDLDG